MTTVPAAAESTPREPWWAPFRRPLTWVVIVGFGVLNVVVQELGVPEPWNAVAFGVLLAAGVWIVTGRKSPWLPLAVFVAVLATHAALRLGGLPAFWVLEGLLLLVAIVLWARRAPKPR